MGSAVEVLAAGGILRPDITIRAAAAASLDLAAACVLVMAETGGGRMIYGHDRVDTGGIYTLGGPVTRENYLAYRQAQKAGKIGRQGVGDCQLTSEEYVARAETIGAELGGLGPWDPYTNQLAGFTGLARLIAASGERNGFRRYNGSGPAAETYAAKSMTALAAWRARLGATAPGPDALPRLREGDTGDAVAAWQRWLVSQGYTIDLGPRRYGPQTVNATKAFQASAGVTGPDADGRHVGPRTLSAAWERGYRG